jgi:hypothetical protein
MVMHHHIGSGSGSKSNRCQIGSLGIPSTLTGNLGMVRWQTPTSSELGGLTAGRLAYPSIDSDKDLDFAVC